MVRRGIRIALLVALVVGLIGLAVVVWFGLGLYRYLPTIFECSTGQLCNQPFEVRRHGVFGA